jgi:hypothetical protein
MVIYSLLLIDVHLMPILAAGTDLSSSGHKPDDGICAACVA